MSTSYKGKRVRCINTFGADTLQYGKEYTVLGTRDNGNTVCIQTPRCMNWYKANRFVAVEPEVKKQDVSKVKYFIGDVVVGIAGVHAGEVLTVAGVSLYDGSIQFDTESSFYHFTNNFALVARELEVLTPEQVFSATLNAERLEYFSPTHTKWIQLSHGNVTVEFIKKHTFRKPPEPLKYYTQEIPKPLQVYNTCGLVYGISFTKREVYKVTISRRTDGGVYWNNPQDAQKALEVILAPLGASARPLSKRLTEE